MSDVARANISPAYIGIKPSEETRAKIAKCKYIWDLTDEGN
jgi:hypothetical protein